MNEAEWLASGDFAAMLHATATWGPCHRCGNFGLYEAAPLAWLECECGGRPRAPMLPQQARLIGCAAARWIGPLLLGPPATAALDAAERHSCGACTSAELVKHERRSTYPITRDLCHPEAWRNLIRLMHRTVDRRGNLRRSARDAGRGEQVAAAEDDLRRTYPALAGRGVQAAVARRMAEIDCLLDEEERQLVALDHRALSDIVREILGNPWHPSPLDAGWLARHGDLPRAMARDIIERRAFAEVGVLGDALEELGCPDEAVVRHCREGAHYLGCWVLREVAGRAEPKG